MADVLDTELEDLFRSTGHCSTGSSGRMAMDQGVGYIERARALPRRRRFRVRQCRHFADACAARWSGRARTSTTSPTSVRLLERRDQAVEQAFDRAAGRGCSRRTHQGLVMLDQSGPLGSTEPARTVSSDLGPGTGRMGRIVPPRGFRPDRARSRSTATTSARSLPIPRPRNAGSRGCARRRAATTVRTAAGAFSPRTAFMPRLGVTWSRLAERAESARRRAGSGRTRRAATRRRDRRRRRRSARSCRLLGARDRRARGPGARDGSSSAARAEIASRAATAAEAEPLRMLDQLAAVGRVTDEDRRAEVGVPT